MLQFKKMMVTGYGSIIKTTKIKLDRPGVNIVIGEVGVGKTTMFSPLRWVISGKSLKGSRNVETWKHLRPDDYKGAQVTLTFKKDDIKYELTRTSFGKKQTLILKDPSGNNLLKGNKLSNQEFIFNFLGFNDEVLVNSIIFGQRMKRLIESSGPDKKKLFEEAFNATFLKDARDSAKLDLDVESSNLKQTEQELELYSERLSGKAQLLKQVKRQRAEFDENQAKTKRNLEDKLKGLEKEYNKDLNEKSLDKRIEKLNNNVKELQSQYFESLSKIRISKNKVNDAQAVLYGLREDKKKFEAEFDKVNLDIDKVNNKVCQYCGSKLSDIKQAKVLKELNKTKDTIDSNLYKLETSILEGASKVEKLKKHSKKLSKINVDDLDKEIEDYKKKINALEKKKFNHVINLERIKSVKASLWELKEKTPPPIPQKLKVEISELEADIERLEKIKVDLVKQVGNINWVYNDLLGNKGLKSYIFDTMLTQLNNLLTYYEQFIGFRVEFNVDLDSANKDIYTVCYIGQEMIYYEELSGGQKQLVDAATTFALYELITQDKPTNLMILDEPFEGLSETASELIFDLIRDKDRDNKSIFIITHNLSLQHSSNKVIRVGIREGQTVLKLL